MKQTAVQWLEEKLFNSYYENVEQIIEQAKEMEKQNIIDAYDVQWEYDVKNGLDYYNKKFKKK